MNLTKTSKLDIDLIHNLSLDEDDFNLAKTYLMSLRSKGGLYSVTVEGELVGVVAGTLICGDAELIQLYIFPEKRGLGLSKKALNLWFDILRGKYTNHIFLEVRKSNKVAKKLYESVGFYKVGLRKNYYIIRDKKHDAVLMKLDM